MAAQQDASLQAARQSARTALQEITSAESKAVATIKELDEQGDTIQRIKARAGAIDASLQVADRQLTSLSSTLGGMLWPWSSSPPARSLREHSGNEHGSEHDSNASSGLAVTSVEDEWQVISTKDVPYVPVEEMSPTGDAVIDRDLHLFSASVARLKHLAQDMNAELDKQDTELQDTNDELDRLADVMARQSLRTQRLLPK
eukprot:m.205289 g.205289  ORF g.205289 m.205289 type:complete len:201 (-) comp18484_c0_seq1:266-868(-)